MPSNALQFDDPSEGSNNPLAQAPSRAPYAGSGFIDLEDELSPLERWLREQRAKNNARGFEPLPGITSGAAPKPWGLDRSQLPQLAPPQPYESGFLANVLNRYRAMDPASDPRMSTWPDQVVRMFKIPRGGTGYTPPTAGMPRRQPETPPPWERPYEQGT